MSGLSGPLGEFVVNDRIGGGTLRVREWGNPSGPVIIAHHGTPSSSAAVPGGWDGPGAAGVRLLTFDRPGYARSTRQAGHTVADAARWSRLIADAAGAERFGVIGTSGGGPYAAATAALLPDRVTALCIDVGLGPGDLAGFDLADGMPRETEDEIVAARSGVAALRAFIDSVDGEALDAWEHLLPPSDREVLGRPEVQREEGLEAEEWGRDGVDGWVDDDLALFGMPWGFDSADIVAPAFLLYGGADVLVPASHGAAWARALPHAELRVIPGGGHWLRDFESEYLVWLAALAVR